MSQLRVALPTALFDAVLLPTITTQARQVTPATMRLLTYLPLLVATGFSNHVPGTCTFHLQMTEFCTPNKSDKPARKINLDVVYDGAHNAFYFPFDDYRPSSGVLAERGNGIGRTIKEQLAWGGTISWLARLPGEDAVWFEYLDATSGKGPKFWTSSNPKSEGYYCDVGDWTQGRLLCEGEVAKWPQPRASHCEKGKGH